MLLEVRQLSFAYPGGPPALDRVTFSLEAGEVVGLVGPNGAGKSTLLRHLVGLLPDPLPKEKAVPEAAPGIWIAGDRLVAERAAAVRRTIGLVFQDPDDQLFAPTLAEDVAFGPLCQGRSPETVRDTVREVLQAIGLAGMGQRPPNRLSLGEKKRAALAGVLACEPDLILLDEPAAHLDARGRRDLIRVLTTLRQALLIATHDLDLVLELCPRVLILDAGRIVADGPTRTILADPDLLENHGLESRFVTRPKEEFA